MVISSTGNRARTVDRNACVSSHERCILRRATLAISFRTCTLMMPPAAMRLSALSAFARSPEARYSTTLVSKKLPGIRFFPVEFEIGGKAPTEGAKAFQQFFAAGLARYCQLTRVHDVDLDVVTLLQRQHLHHRAGKADGEAIAPFRDLHGALLGYTL